jgi:NAD(P)-dependent dehydrogenase (short-subunit alcohol dehydrogenase family)
MAAWVWSASSAAKGSVVGPPSARRPLNVTRAALKVLRSQHSGLVVTMSSTAGLIGQDFCTAYAASMFGLEGWMESLAPEVAPFGIRTMVVEPAFFRTDLLTPESTNFAEPSIQDYAPRTEEAINAWQGMNGQQGGGGQARTGPDRADGPGRAARSLGRWRGCCADGGSLARCAGRQPPFTQGTT